jgi:hypothetical protein
VKEKYSTVQCKRIMLNNTVAEAKANHLTLTANLFIVLLHRPLSYMMGFDWKMDSDDMSGIVMDRHRLPDIVSAV